MKLREKLILLSVFELYHRIFSGHKMPFVGNNGLSFYQRMLILTEQSGIIDEVIFLMEF